jgi:UDP-N-acetylmuramate: L-alanyl-gamma-D-glutamyl-meso-diaminopimelate ligase
MAEADIAFVYYNPEVLQQKGLAEINPEQVKRAFGGQNLTVYNNLQALQQNLCELNYDNSALLLMTSGNLSGVNLIEFARELLEKQ